MRSNMNPKLAARLMAAYPRVFSATTQENRDAKLLPEIHCGDGWYTLLDTLCTTLQFAADHGEGPQPVTRSVKESGGVLTVQLRRASEYQQGMIEMADAFSARLCDQCGAPGRLHAIPAAGISRADDRLEQRLATRCPRHRQYGRDVDRHPNLHVTAGTLTSTLLAAHPQLFPDPLPRGIECGPGWFPLIDALCHRLTLDARSRDAVLPPVRQVKEKLGGLRFHMFNTTARQRGMIAFAIAMSEHVCEVCGHHGTNRPTTTGLATRCARHRDP